MLVAGVGDVWGDNVNDVIDNVATKTLIGNTGSTSWTDINVTGESGAEYTIHTMGIGSDMKALQWNKNGYLFTTKSGGKLKSVTIFGAAKTVNIFASTSAYSEKATGTSLVQLTISSSGATYTFTGDYNYLAINGTETSTSITSITIEWEPESTDPSISADDLDLSANATSGEIPFTIKNPDGSTLSAIKKTGDWISNVAVSDGKVMFSSTVNDGSPRDGVITLTYGTVTRDVTVHQNGKSTVTIVAPENGTLVMKDGDTEIASGTKVEIGTILTAVPSPATGYKFNNCQALDGSTHTYTSTFTYTVKDANVTFKANFVPIVYYTVTWSVNGVETTESVEENTEINFVNPTESIPSGYKFMGWIGTELAPQNTAPTYVTSATSTGNVTYYAVFAKNDETVVWEKLSVTQVSAEGTYAILTTDGHAFNGTITSGHGQVTSTAFSFTNNIAEVAPEGTCEITLIAKGSGVYKMYNENLGYLYAKAASSGNLEWAVSDENGWKVYSNNWEYNKNYSNKYAYLRDYQNSSFRTYNSTSNGNVISFAHKTTTSSAYDFRTSVTESVTVSAAGFATYVSDNDLDYTNVEGLKAFSAQVDNTNATVSFAPVGKVKAGEGVLLKANGGSYNVPVTSGVAENASNDFIRGEGTAVASEDNGKYNYILNNVGGVVAFYAANGQNVATNRAYLQTTTANARISLNFDDETTTGINATMKDKETNSKVYNLNGQRVNNPAKGLYIVNGKKVIIK